jgi:hypothetical protein
MSEAGAGFDGADLAVRHEPAVRLSKTDMLAAAGWFVVMSTVVFFLSSWMLPFTGWKEFDNIYFQADIALVYSNMTEFDSNHHRTGMHPLFSIVMWPLVTLLVAISDATPAVIVRLLLAFNAGATAALAYLIVHRIAATRIDASLYTLLLCVSSSTVFWLTVPETFPFGGTTILFMLALAAIVARPRIPALVFANVVTMSMTLTNWMVAIYATLRLLWPRWRTSVSVFVIAGCVVILFGIASKLFIPSSGYVGDFRRYIAWIRPPATSDVRSFFAHSVVMPAPVFRTRGDGVLEVVNEISPAGSGSGTGAVGVVLWLLLLAVGAAGAVMRGAGTRAFRDILLLCLGSQFLLHVMFADGPFLFSAHFVPLLILLAAYASKFRWSRPLVVATIVTVSFNNLAVFDQVRDRLERDVLPWLERHGTPMTKPPLAPPS